MPLEEKFLCELNVFSNEIDSALKSLYTELAIHEIATNDKSALKAMNRNPIFWNTILNGLQHSTFIILGRMLGIGKHNILELYRTIEMSRYIFTKESFAMRFMKYSKNVNKKEKWQEEYVNKIFVPTDKDFIQVKEFIDNQISTYKKYYRPIRDHFGHKTFTTNEEVKLIFDIVNIRDLEKFCVKLKNFHEALWQLYYNGHGPIFPMTKGRYSTKSILKNGSRQYHSAPANEQIIQDVKNVLELLKVGNNINARLENI